MRVPSLAAAESRAPWYYHMISHYIIILQLYHRVARRRAGSLACGCGTARSAPALGAKASARKARGSPPPFGFAYCGMRSVERPRGGGGRSRRRSVWLRRKRARRCANDSGRDSGWRAGWRAGPGPGRRGGRARTRLRVRRSGSACRVCSIAGLRAARGTETMWR